MKTYLNSLSLYLSVGVLLSDLACAQNSPTPSVPPSLSSTFSQPIDQGAVKNPAINEASGIVASYRNPGTLWTHNDSGGEPKIYAITTSGETVGEWLITGATNRDWEDIAIGPGPEDSTIYLYVGDIGDNQAVHSSLNIYRFPEPVVDDENPSYRVIDDAEKISLKYPDGARDAETLFVDPFTKDLYILSKRDRFARLYQLPFPQSTSSTVVAKKVGEWPREIGGIFNQPVGGDVSPDGRELLLKSYVEVLYWQREDAQTSIFELIQQEPKVLPYTVEPQGEAVGWAADGSGYYTFSEKKGDSNPRLYFYKRKNE